MKLFTKKGILTMGYVLMFIGIVLVCTFAAGIVVNASGQVKEKVIRTSDVARQSVTPSIEIITTKGFNNVDSNYLYGFDVAFRLAPGSNPIHLNDLVFRVDTDDGIFFSDFSNISMGSCPYLEPPTINHTQYCVDMFKGNGNLVLEDGEMMCLFWFFENSTYYLGEEEKITVSFITAENPILSHDMFTPYQYTSKVMPIYG